MNINWRNIKFSTNVAQSWHFKSQNLITNIITFKGRWKDMIGILYWIWIFIYFLSSCMAMETLGGTHEAGAQREGSNQARCGDGILSSKPTSTNCNFYNIIQIKYTFSKSNNYCWVKPTSLILKYSLLKLNRLKFFDSSKVLSVQLFFHWKKC